MSLRLVIGRGTRLYKGFIVAVFVFIAIIGISLWYADPQFISHFKAEVTMKKIQLTNEKIYVWVASTPEEQRASLTNLTSMPQDEGMLFVFLKTDTYRVWTEEMQFPVDIIWIGDDGEVVSVASNIAPGVSYPTYPTAPAQYVLMLNAGVAAQNNIVVHSNIDVTRIF